MSKRDTESLQLSLTAEQGNLVITALAECPFKLVYELIGKLNRQANVAAQAGGTYACQVGAAELKLMLDALGKLPYVQVHALVHELQRQLQEQLQEQVAAAGKASKTGRKAGKR
ncbi:hypothetical protein [Herbaspirillum rhizosphaerae]|uniref:hypothetical protein n=1 Tax=Herbaspirillum rhizosphaerae TaxID=346179 RepID=UPI00067D7056|nr:hypothetical protein [Herbaspirillum rhizosphaerae]